MTVEREYSQMSPQDRQANFKAIFNLLPPTVDKEHHAIEQRFGLSKALEPFEEMLETVEDFDELESLNGLRPVLELFEQIKDQTNDFNQFVSEVRRGSRVLIFAEKELSKILSFSNVTNSFKKHILEQYPLYFYLGIDKTDPSNTFRLGCLSWEQLGLDDSSGLGIFDEDNFEREKQCYTRLRTEFDFWRLAVVDNAPTDEVTFTHNLFESVESEDFDKIPKINQVVKKGKFDIWRVEIIEKYGEDPGGETKIFINM